EGIALLPRRFHAGAGFLKARPGEPVLAALALQQPAAGGDERHGRHHGDGEHDPAAAQLPHPLGVEDEFHASLRSRTMRSTKRDSITSGSPGVLRAWSVKVVRVS